MSHNNPGSCLNQFSGFTPAAQQFLRDLLANNNKPWFEEHRQAYQRDLLEPMQALADEMGAFMLSIDPYIAIRRPVSRIHRDTRFSKDKSPYRGTIWLSYKRPQKQWTGSPAYFLEIGADSYRYGMGFYSAEKASMDRLRAFIDENPGKFLQMISFFPGQNKILLEGELYKRPLAANRAPELQTWYQRKSLYLVCNCSDSQGLYSPALVEELMDVFGKLAPLYHFLWEMVIG